MGDVAEDSPSKKSLYGTFGVTAMLALALLNAEGRHWPCVCFCHSCRFDLRSKCARGQAEISATIQKQSIYQLSIEVGVLRVILGAFHGLWAAR